MYENFSKNPIVKKENRVYLLIGLIILAILSILIKIGILGIAAASFLLFLIIFTPLVLNRYGFFLFIWLLIAPAFDNVRDLLIGGTNPVVFLITAATFPFAMLLFMRDTIKVVKKLPFVGLLLLFNLTLFLNILRPDVEQGVLQEGLKIFFEIFVIFCFYHHYQAQKTDNLFKQINYFFIFNSCIAFFQRITGIGLSVIEGLPRAGGLVGHPNALAFLNVIYIPFGVYQVCQAKNPKERNFWLFGLITTTLALLLTLCKNVILTMAIQYFVLFWFLPNKYKVRCIYVVLSIGAILLGINAFSDFGLFHLFSERFSNNDSMVWRYRVWGYLLNDINLTNIWLGHGVNAGKAAIEAYNPFGPKQPTFVHNVYLQLLYENGLTGMLLLIAFLQPAILFLKSFFQTTSTQQKLAAVIPLLIILAIFINMATDNSVFLRTPMSFAWLFLSYFYLLNHESRSNLIKPC